MTTETTEQEFMTKVAKEGGALFETVIETGMNVEDFCMHIVNMIPIDSLDKPLSIVVVVTETNTHVAFATDKKED